MKLLHADITTISLLLANLVTIFSAVIQHWSLLVILWTYWCQSVIIGVFNFFRILNLKDFSAKGFTINRRAAKLTEQTKVFTAIFFAIHYMGFHMGYASFLSLYTLGIISPTFGVLTHTSSMPRESLSGLVFVPFLAMVFFVNHLISYKFYKDKPKKKQNIGTIMFYPYARILPMHATIVCGGFFAGSSQALLFFFLLLKTAADVIMHSIEHRQQWQ